MLTFQTTVTEIDRSGDMPLDWDNTSQMTFEAPNPQVAMSFVSAFNAIESSTWSDCHVSLGWEPQIVNGPCVDHMSWDEIQQDRNLSSEMPFWPQSTAVA